MTLIEMLIATAVSLILMAAVAQVFAAFSGAMSNGRSILETDSRLRNVARRLRDDLNGATTQMLPPRTPDQGQGYFEIIEGPINDLFGYTSEDRNANGSLEPVEETGDGTFPPPPYDRLGVTVNGALDAPALRLNTDLSSDIDDVLLFTTRSKTTPFVGRSPTGTFESQTAEVTWFVRPTSNTSNPQTYTLYRKQLLVMGYVAGLPFSNKFTDGYDNDGDGSIDEFDERPDQDGIDNDGDGSIDEGDGSEYNLVTANSAGMNQYGNSWSSYYLAPCDISVRRERRTGAGGFDALVPNTLGDLTRRENRFLHNPTGDTTGVTFPYAFASDIDFDNDGILDTGEDVNGSGATVTVLDFDHLSPQPPDGLVFDGTARRGEDIVLTNVLGFDVRVFDPAAPIQVEANTAIVPGDDVPDNATTLGADHLNYFTNPSSPGSPADGTGAYVDLGNNVMANSLPSFSVNPLFSNFGNSLSGLNGSATSRRTYCTWSTHYEANGIDEDGIDGTDQGTDGLDSSTPLNSLVDESSEQETSPPYPYPLRGVEVRIRVYEPRSRQVRQVTVRHTFVPH